MRRRRATSMGSLAAYAALGRLGAAGGAAVPYGVGPIAYGASWSATITCLSIGVLVHSVGCHLNDVADLSLDRAHPRRQGSPLVAGVVSVRAAMTSAAVQAVLLLGLIASLPGPAAAKLALVAIFGLNSYVNVRQHWSRVVSPIVMDFLFGVACGAPVVLATWGAGVRPYAAGYVLAVAMLLHAVVLNSGGGNLKDLANDASHGARTTALALGVRAGPDPRLPQLTRSYRRFLLVTELGAVGLTTPGAFLGPRAGERWWIPLTVFVLEAMALYNVSALSRLDRQQPGPVAWYPLPSLVGYVLAFAAIGHPRGLVLLFVAAAMWPALVAIGTGRTRSGWKTVRGLIARPS